MDAPNLPVDGCPELAELVSELVVPVDGCPELVSRTCHPELVVMLFIYGLDTNTKIMWRQISMPYSVAMRCGQLEHLPNATELLSTRQWRSS